MLVAVGAAAAVVLWSSAGWSGVALIVAVATVVGVGFLPRRLPALLRKVRRRAVPLAVGAGLAALTLLSSPWAIVLAAGVVALAAAPRVLERARVVHVSVAVLLVVAGLAGLVAERLAAGTARDTEAAAAHDRAFAQMLPHTPTAAVYELARVIARPDTGARACGLLFTDRGAAEFAAAHAAPECPTAVQVVGSQVTYPDHYDRFDPATAVVSAEQDGAVTIDACDLRWRDSLDVILGNEPRPDLPPGPAIGVVSVAPTYGTAWQIIGFRRC